MDTNKMDPKIKSEESGFDDHFRYPTQDFRIPHLVHYR